MLFRSVTARLVFLYCLLLVLLGGAFLAFTVLSFQHYTRQTIDSTLSARTQEIWNVSQGALEFPARLEEVMERRFAPESQDRFIRIRAGSKILYRSGFPAGSEFAPDILPSPVVGIGKTKVWQDGYVLLNSRSFADAFGNTITVDAGQSYQLARTVESRLATSLFVGLPVLLLLAAIAGYVMMRSALKPVEVMIKAAESFTFNDPHNRLPLVGTEPRIEALGLALNRMLDRLDSSYSHVSRFSADAAHELRTPITIIRGELELVATGERRPEEVGHAIANALEEMTRLTGIVDSLITLSRMDSVWGKRVHSPVDLQALATETIDQMSLLAEEKSIILGAPSGAPVMVAGDRERLKQILVNLIDNAIKYTPVGGRVRVETGTGADTGYVAVEDNGIGIDPNHHDKVFDRFYRVTPDRGAEGAGLGLAIVKSICHAHGGAVSLRSVPGFGSVFRVDIPLGAAPGMAAAETAAAIGNPVF